MSILDHETQSDETFLQYVQCIYDYKTNVYNLLYFKVENIYDAVFWRFLKKKRIRAQNVMHNLGYDNSNFIRFSEYDKKA